MSKQDKIRMSDHTIGLIKFKIVILKGVKKKIGLSEYEKSELKALQSDLDRMEVEEG